MILECQSCGKRFDKDLALTEHFPGGEAERFCPYCGSDDIQEVAKREKGSTH